MKKIQCVQNRGMEKERESEKEYKTLSFCMLHSARVWTLFVVGTLCIHSTNSQNKEIFSHFVYEWNT